MSLLVTCKRLNTHGFRLCVNQVVRVRYSRQSKPSFGLIHRSVSLLHTSDSHNREYFETLNRFSSVQYLLPFDCTISTFPVHPTGFLRSRFAFFVYSFLLVCKSVILPVNSFVCSFLFEWMRFLRQFDRWFDRRWLLLPCSLDRLFFHHSFLIISAYTALTWHI